MEREKRAMGGTNVVRIYSGEQRVPRQWKKFMASGENKEEIMKFIFNFVVTPCNFIIAKLSIRKPGSSSVLIKSDLF